MNTLTTVIFLLDILSLKEMNKKNLTNIQIKKIENLIKVLYSKTNNTQPIVEAEYLELYRIYKSKNTDEEDRLRRNAMKEMAKDIVEYLNTGISNKTLENNDDKVVESLNKAYKFIIESIQDSLHEIINEHLEEKDIQNLKSDFSKNANIEIARLYVLSKATKEEFCIKTFITQARLNRALAYVLSSNDENLQELKEKIFANEIALEEELHLIEQVLMNYNRREKNITLIELQSLTALTLSALLKELRERKSKAYDKLKEMYYEYQNKMTLQPINFEAVRNTRTIINGREMTEEDHMIIENFIKENKYPEQRAIYAYVKDAYLKGNLDSLRREVLKEKVLTKFNILEKPKEKCHK